MAGPGARGGGGRVKKKQGDGVSRSFVLLGLYWPLGPWYQVPVFVPHEGLVHW